MKSINFILPQEYFHFSTIGYNREKLVARLLGAIPNIDETRAIYGVEIRDTGTESITNLPVIGLDDNQNVLVLKPHLKSIVADAHSVAVLGSAEFDNIPMLERMGTPAQDNQLALDRDARTLGEAHDGLLSHWMYQDGEHENYRALRLLALANGIHELALSASRMRRSSFATSSGVESSKKSIKSSNIFLDMEEDGATTPRMFSSLMMVMDDLFMRDSVSQGMKNRNTHCRGDVRNNGRRTTVYLHTRNRFSFYFCANMRPIACERSFPRLGQLAQNVVYRLTSRDVNRQLIDVGCFSLFAAACFRKLMLPRNRPTRSFQLSDVPSSPEEECFSQTIISNTTPYHLPRMIALPVRESSCLFSERVDKAKPRKRTP